MDKLKKLLEQQNIFWVLIAGLALIIFGIYQFFEIKEMEANNIPVRLKKIFELIYNVGGKYTLLFIFESIGIAATVSAILQFRKKL